MKRPIKAMESSDARSADGAATIVTAGVGRVTNDIWETPGSVPAIADSTDTVEGKHSAVESLNEGHGPTPSKSSRKRANRKKVKQAIADEAARVAEENALLDSIIAKKAASEQAMKDEAARIAAEIALLDSIIAKKSASEEATVAEHRRPSGRDSHTYSHPAVPTSVVERQEYPDRVERQHSNLVNTATGEAVRKTSASAIGLQSAPPSRIYKHGPVSFVRLAIQNILDDVEEHRQRHLAIYKAKRRQENIDIQAKIRALKMMIQERGEKEVEQLFATVTGQTEMSIQDAIDFESEATNKSASSIFAMTEKEGQSNERGSEIEVVTSPVDPFASSTFSFTAPNGMNIYHAEIGPDEVESEELSGGEAAYPSRKRARRLTPQSIAYTKQSPSGADLSDMASNVLDPVDELPGISTGGGHSRYPGNSQCPLTRFQDDDCNLCKIGIPHECLTAVGKPAVLESAFLVRHEKADLDDDDSLYEMPYSWRSSKIKGPSTEQLTGSQSIESDRIDVLLRGSSPVSINQGSCVEVPAGQKVDTANRQAEPATRKEINVSGQEVTTAEHDQSQLDKAQGGEVLPESASDGCSEATTDVLNCKTEPPTTQWLVLTPATSDTTQDNARSAAPIQDENAAERSTSVEAATFLSEATQIAEPEQKTIAKAAFDTEPSKLWMRSLTAAADSHRLAAQEAKKASEFYRKAAALQEEIARYHEQPATTPLESLKRYADDRSPPHVGNANAIDAGLEGFIPRTVSMSVGNVVKKMLELHEQGQISIVAIETLVSQMSPT